MDAPLKKRIVEIKFSVSSLMTLLAIYIVISMGKSIAPLFLPTLIAIFLAIALNSVVDWLAAKKCPRRMGIIIVTISLAFLLTLILVTIVPNVYKEAIAFIQNIPQFRQDILNNLDAQNPIREWINRSLQNDNLIPKTNQMKDILGAGNLVLGGLGDVFLIFILAIYLLAEGPRLVEWVTAFFEPKTQEKIKQTTKEISGLVSAYILGQVLTSFMAFLFVLISLELLDVPGAPLLATLAGIMDVLPVLGFVLSVVPAMLFAANVSVELSWIVLLLFTVYHLIEVYFIIPLVYGNRMRVSSLVVFLSLIAAGLMGGIEGALVGLPIVASYPIIERIWLHRYVREEALVEHAPM